MIITPLKVMTLYVILTMSSKILLDLKLQSTTETCYILNKQCVMLYYGGFHFTCQIIDEFGNIWFHDGMTTARTTIKEGQIGSVSQPDLKNAEINSYVM